MPCLLFEGLTLPAAVVLLGKYLVMSLPCPIPYCHYEVVVHPYLCVYEEYNYCIGGAGKQTSLLCIG